MKVDRKYIIEYIILKIENHYKESLAILKQFMRKDMFDKLQFIEAPTLFDESAKTSKKSQF